MLNLNINKVIAVAVLLLSFFIVNISFASSITKLDAPDYEDYYDTSSDASDYSGAGESDYSGLWALGGLIVAGLIIYGLYDTYSESSNSGYGSANYTDSSPDVNDEDSDEDIDYSEEDYTEKPLTGWGDEAKDNVNPNSAWGKLRIKVFDKYGRKCAECDSTKNLTVHHKIELSLGGTNTLENLEPICRKCHEKIHNHAILEGRVGDLDNYGKNPHLNPKVKKIAKLIRDSGSVKIRYTKFDGAKSTRVISPKRVFRANKRIYVRAYCQLRGSERTFRLSRMKIVAGA